MTFQSIHQTQLRIDGKQIPIGAFSVDWVCPECGSLAVRTSIREEMFRCGSIEQTECQWGGRDPIYRYTFYSKDAE